MYIMSIMFVIEIKIIHFVYWNECFVCTGFFYIANINILMLNIVSFVILFKSNFYEIVWRGILEVSQLLFFGEN